MDSLNRKGLALSNLVIEVFRLNRLLLDAGDEFTKPVGLTSARRQVLGVVEHGPAPVAHIARTMGLTRQSVQQTADSLADDELVQYVENPNHRRAMLLQITPKGHKALEYVTRRQIEWANALGEKISLKDLASALTVLQTIQIKLDQAASQPNQPESGRKGMG